MNVQRLKPEDIKVNADNPRTISDANFKKLVKSMKDIPEMADVRPVVINMDNMILGGNMRYQAMVSAGWKEIPVMQVDWSEEKQREFIIKDNVSGGDWDWDSLLDEWDTDLLSDWGLDIDTKHGKSKADVEGEIEFTEELGEEQNYVVLHFNNEVDWLQAQTILGLKTVKALDSKPGFMKMGVGRVVDGVEAIRRIQDENKY